MRSRPTVAKLVVPNLVVPRLVPAMLAAAAALLIAGCSSDAGQDAPTTTSVPQPPPGPATHGGLAECLKGQGVADAGGPAAVLGPPAGVDQATWDKAMRACSSLAPGPGAP